MSEPTYTTKEIMDFHFKRFDEKLDDIKGVLEKQNQNSEKRFIALETDVANLKTFQTRAMVVWTLVTFAITIAINRYL